SPANSSFPAPVLQIIPLRLVSFESAAARSRARTAQIVAALDARDRRLQGRGRSMGAEIKDTITKRLAPHRQYLPTDTRTVVEVPEPRREWGLYPGEPE